MRGQQYQYRGVVFLVLTVLSGIISPFIVTIETFAQTPSTQMQCREVEIKNYIQKLSNGEQSIYNALVACKDKAVPQLIKTLKNQNQQVRIMVITALGEIGSPDAVLPLSDLLSKETRWDVRTSVIFALSNFDKQSVPTLITALKDKDWYIRYQAANALAEIGFDAKDAIPALNNAVKDENINVRSAAKTALESIKKQEYYNSVFSHEQNAISTTQIDNIIYSQKNQSKSPLICRYPALHKIFQWKCPQNQRGSKHGR
jgi:HEAT repeats